MSNQIVMLVIGNLSPNLFLKKQPPLEIIKDQLEILSIKKQGLFEHNKILSI